MATKLRCFVAMAFGHNDTDAMYKKLVATYKSRLNFRRVDQINHNDDIDDRIITELDAADFVIADLTYARPSAYYEAGYAKGRGLGVIHTVRKDHISRRQTSAVDAFITDLPETPKRQTIKRLMTDTWSVHFDLQMKNIVDWSGPDDAQFLRSLTKRIDLVTAPLLRDEAAAEAKAGAVREFAKLSHIEQIGNATVEVMKYLKTNGFQIVYTKHDSTDRLDVAMYRAGSRIESAVKLVGDTLYIVGVWVIPKLTKSGMSTFGQLVWQVRTVPNLNVADKAPTKIVRMNIILSLSRASERIVREALPSAAIDNMTATRGPHEFYIPSSGYWRSGNRIELLFGDSFRIGNAERSYEAEKDGLKGEYTDAAKGIRKRMGNVAACPMVEQFVFITDIKETVTLAKRVAGAFL